MKGFALSLTLKQRLKAIRQWPIHFALVIKEGKKSAQYGYRTLACSVGVFCGARALNNNNSFAGYSRRLR